MPRRVKACTAVAAACSTPIPARAGGRPPQRRVDRGPRAGLDTLAAGRRWWRARRRWYRCGGLVAEEYDLLGAEPCVRGQAWCGPDGQESWRFVLLVDPATRSRDEIDWSALLPA